MVAPESPEPLQTLASVRISQLKFNNAREALARSIQLWKDLEPEDPRVPDFPSRISLSRLLMESEMEEDALEVLERLITEDDSSVEAWYLGGWCLHLLSQKGDATAGDSIEGDNASKDASLAHSSRDWLKNCLKLYELFNYEDDRMRDHALEIVESIDRVLGPTEEGKDPVESDDEGEWEDEDINEDDEEMEGT